MVVVAAVAGFVGVGVGVVGVAVGVAGGVGVFSINIVHVAGVAVDLTGVVTAVIIAVAIPCVAVDVAAVEVAVAIDIIVPVNEPTIGVTIMCVGVYTRATPVMSPRSGGTRRATGAQLLTSPHHTPTSAREAAP